MKKNQKFSLKDRIRSFKYAFEGISYFFRSVHNGWVHLTATLTAIFFGIYFDLSSSEWLWVIQAIFMVFIAEFINTAIEQNVDLVTEEKNEKAKRAKDLAAAAVFIAAVYAIIVAVFVFYPYVKEIV